jgi:hypothetical protein
MCSKWPLTIYTHSGPSWNGSNVHHKSGMDLSYVSGSMQHAIQQLSSSPRFHCIHQGLHTSKGVRSGDLGGPATGSCRPIKLLWKCWLSNPVTCLPKWGVGHLAVATASAWYGEEHLLKHWQLIFPETGHCSDVKRSSSTNGPKDAERKQEKSELIAFDQQ